MRNKLFLLALTCLPTSPIAAMEEGAGLEGPLKRLKLEEGAPASQENVQTSQITIELTDGEVNLDKAKFLPILQQSKTISDLLEDVKDVQTDVIAFPLPNMTKGEFEQALSLMTLDGPSRSQVLADFDIKKLSTYWNIFNYLDVSDLLKLVNTDLSQKLFAQVKENPEVIPELLQGIPDQFKRTKVSFFQLKSLLPESIQNKLISKLTTLDHTGYVYSVDFDPRHNLLATGSWDGRVNIYTISDDNKISLLTTFEDDIAGVLSVAFDPRHKLLATGLEDGRVNIYTISDDNKISLLTTLKDHTLPVKSVAFDQNHNLLATGSWDGRVNIYTISDDNKISLLTTFEDDIAGVRSVAFDPRHKLLATGLEDGRVNIYTISDDNRISLLTTFADHTNPVLSVAFDPRHKLFATGSGDGSNIYTISDDNKISLLTTFADHTDLVLSVAFDPRHKLLATGSGDETVKIYTISDDNRISLLTTLKDHADTDYAAEDYGYEVGVNSVDFDPRHNLLAAGSWDGRVIMI